MDVSGLLLHAAEFSAARSTKVPGFRVFKTTIAIALGLRAATLNGWCSNPQKVLGNPGCLQVA